MTDVRREYAEALFSLARETGADFDDDLALVERLLAENPDYLSLLTSPGVPLTERTAAIAQALGDAVAPPVVAFVQVLCQRGRIRELPACIAAYRDLMQAANRQSVARVISAVELTAAEQDALRRRLEAVSGHAVTLQCETDPSLLGGAIVHMDGNVLDGTLRRRLHDMKEVMEQ